MTLKEEEGEVNIFLCYTPLHILISKRIIEEEVLQNNWLLFYGERTKKNLFYFYRFKSIFERMYFIEKINSPRSLYEFFRILKILNKLKKPVNFFCGNIKKSFSRLMLYAISKSNLYTFDDGSGNVSGEGYFYNQNERRIQRLFFLLFNKELLYKNVTQRIKLHYTIYKLPNVYSPTKYIPLFNPEKITLAEGRGKGKISILLGNAFYEDGEMSLKEEISLYRKLRKKFSIEYMIPHPREVINKAQRSGLQRIDSEYISEEEILRLLQTYNTITVVGIYSTVLLNLASLNFKRIEVINVKAPVKKPVHHMEKLFDTIGIPTIHIGEEYERLSSP